MSSFSETADTEITVSSVCVVNKTESKALGFFNIDMQNTIHI